MATTLQEDSEESATAARPDRGSIRSIDAPLRRTLCRRFGRLTSLHWLSPLLILVFYDGLFTSALPEVVCGGFDMRNSPAHFLSQQHGEPIDWHDCTVIEGDVRYILMTNPENMTADEFKAVSLTNVREVTGSVLVFQVAGLESLSVLLPNLRIIRGNSKVLNYALVLFQNPSLKEIGLPKLMEISHGGVRIAMNGELCYASTVDFNSICLEKGLIVVESNQNPNNCADKCKNSSNSCLIKDSTQDSQPIGCWNYDDCQSVCPSHCLKDNLTCNLNDHPPTCCHPQCAGGCNGTTKYDCYACRNVYVNGACEAECPKHLYMILGRRCISSEECMNRTHLIDEQKEPVYYKPLADGTCDTKCPNGHYVDPNNRYRCIECRNNKDCVKKCYGGMITSLNDAEHLRGCNIIYNYLDISIQSGLTKNVVQQLEDLFGDIREVTDYVKISFSPSFVSLNMLKNLRAIRGQNLLNNKYVLSVFENQNLAQLWNFTDKLVIGAGTIQFHNNPRLCYQTIMELVKAVGLKNVSEHDVSQVSNGNKAVCEELELTLKFIHVDQEYVVLAWEEFNTSMMDHRMFLGYQLYYRSVESEGINIFEGRDACHDSWQMVFLNAEDRGYFLNDLRPYTLYAFYLTTLMVNSPGAKGGISKVYYRRTKFSHPSQPRVTRVISTSASTIYLEWEPPLEPNGEVTHYMISYVAKSDALPKERNYCDEPPNYKGTIDTPIGEAPDRGTTSIAMIPSGTCAQHQCCDCSSPLANISSRVPDQKAVSEQRERAQFENAIHNFIFVNNQRRKRSIGGFGMSSESQRMEGAKNNGTLSKGSSKNATSDEETIEEDAEQHVSQPLVVNVTSLNFTLGNLHHFTSYEIRIWACQNISVEDNYCSRQEVLKIKRSSAVVVFDAINDTSIQIVNTSESTTNTRAIRWDPPENPNGLIVGYEVEYVNHDSSVKKPKKDCVSVHDYVKRRGHQLTDLPPGNWSVRIRCLSLAQKGPWSQRCFFFIPEPYKLPNAAVILICVACSLTAVGAVVFLVTCLHRRNLKKKLPEYIMSVFSANPEYISQLEVYKPDQWELRREDIELSHQIGRGTFGTVYAGTAKKIQSVCGVVFGECAVKTVSERASIYDRWHFLIEASVMKQFNTAFIVKLYGVVSEGQPALVVMEIMHKGNLKDYLRSRRPNAEENIDGLSTPTLAETLEWAGEIADGMAYLEAEKFCHRDLAARNCMVTAENVCKIGDFGMARDVYVKDYYRPLGKRLMPVRWMAPEALKDATFTPRADVWSYGVVLWEMATLASQPYAGLSNEDVMRYVVDHRRVMEMPTGCPAKLYDIMLMCWRYESKDRPTFADICEILLQDMNENFRRVSYTCSQRKREPSRSTHSNHQNTFAPLSSSPATTSEGREMTDVEAPLHCPKDAYETALIDVAGTDSEGELKEPVCSNNRRVGMAKSHSTPSWPRKCELQTTIDDDEETTRSDSAQAILNEMDGRLSNGALLNGHATLLT